MFQVRQLLELIGAQYFHTVYNDSLSVVAVLSVVTLGGSNVSRESHSQLRTLYYLRVEVCQDPPGAPSEHVLTWC